MEGCENTEELPAVKPFARHLDPFWATRLWQNLIREVLTNVNVTKQRHFLKVYDDVFNGEELVDVVFRFLKQCSTDLVVDNVERINAIKVCQVLMDKKLFECVAPKGVYKFADSFRLLFRFSDDVTMQKSVLTENNVLLSMPACSNSLHQASSLKLPKSCNSNRLSCGKAKMKAVNLNSVCPSDEATDQIDIKEPPQDVILAYLLCHVEVPILEGVLSIPSDMQELPQAQVLSFENKFHFKENVNITLKGLCQIPWAKAATACVGYPPPNISKLWSVQSCKIHCYKTVVEHFCCLNESLIPDACVGIFTSVFDLLKQEQRERAVTALQLFFAFLPLKRRNQLHLLLDFLKLVIEDIFVSVDKKVTNYEAVVRDFLHTIFKHPLVSEEIKKILFDFMVFKVHVLFKKPSCLEGGDNFAMRFCQPRPAAEASHYTLDCLEDLASSIMDSTCMKLAQKKAWLNKFKKHHPQVYKNIIANDNIV